MVAIALDMAFSHSSRGRLTDKDLGRFPGDDALRSDRTRRMSGGLSATQGALRSVGGGATRPTVVPGRTGRGPRRRPRPARAGHARPRRFLAGGARRGQGAACLERARPRGARAILATIVRAHNLRRGCPGRRGCGVRRCRGVEPRVWPVDRRGARPRRRRPRPRGSVALLPRPRGVRRRRALSGWVEGPLAIDIMRAVRLEQQGYRIWTQSIPATVTPKNRLLIGAPPQSVQA